MAEATELRAADVLSEENQKAELFLTNTQLKRRYGKGWEIVYFLENSEPKDTIARQQAVLKLAQETGGWVFTGIHSETDWSKTRWWDSGWHLANRTGEYVVVFNTIAAIRRWLDTHVIAEGILDCLEEEEIESTFENAKRVWLDVLYQELPDGVSRSVEALANKGDFVEQDAQLPESISTDGSIAK
jgi:hypothetical protein